MRDEIYKDKVYISKFTFNQKVVDVFDDMVLRSVPGYKQMIELIGLAIRSKLIKRMYDSLLPGGALITCEKIIHKNEETNKSLISLHESFKRENGYSQTEIAQKRKAIEDVLILESIERQLKRLIDAGFKKPLVQMQCINFVSFLAVK